MKKKCTAALLSLLLCSSCITQPAISNVAELGEGANTPIPTLVGKSSSIRWFWLCESGDDSVELARKNGGITHISSITRTTDSYLGLIVRRTTTVRGE